MPELPDKAHQFIDWYLEVVERAGLTDKRYPVKGMNVWTPYGFLARRHLDNVLIREAEASGAAPVEFPALIPQTEFQKEKEHIKGFDAQVYWVTRGGTAELDIPLVLRPTSETAMYPVFALWVRSHRDLPLNLYQIVNTFRYETKTTRPFLRVREIHFFEEHTCQVDEAAATARVQANLAAFAKIAEALALPYVPVRRPEWDKFAGAHYSIAFDIPVGEGRTLQIGSVHHYRENFSRPYGISYEDADGSRKFVHQTTFGLSERLLGAVVAVHGDAKGVAFPTSIAPYQVVLVPIVGAKSVGADPRAAARDLAARLVTRGLRVHVDDSDERPGSKYYHWELLGAPLRLEMGSREAAAGTVTAVDRLGTRQVLGPDDLEGAVAGALRAFDAALTSKAVAAFRSAFTVVRTVEELRAARSVRVLAWCGSEECGHRVEEAVDGGLLGTPEGPLPVEPGPPGPCVVCGRAEPTVWALAAQPL
jgi:prolyl-tRNA synthetase